MQNKKYRLIIPLLAILVILMGWTAYALIDNNNNSIPSNNTPDVSDTSSAKNDASIPDSLNVSHPSKSPEDVNNSNADNTTYISKTDNESGSLYEFTLDDIDRTKNGIEIGYTTEIIGDYIYVYGYTATRAGGTVENGGLVPQDTGYDAEYFGWHVCVVNKEKESYGPICEYINGIPVTDVTYLFAECNNITDDGYPNLPKTVPENIKFRDGWQFKK